MLTAIVLLVFAVVFMIDFLPLNRIISPKEKWVYGAFMLLSMGVLMMYSMDITVPSPSKLIINALDAIIPSLKQ